MKKSSILIIILILGALYSAYYVLNRPPDYKLGANFDLKIGDKAKVGDLTLRLLAVDEDSRCPVGLKCVWEGSVQAKISVKSPNAEQDLAIDWSTGGQIIDGYEIRILDVKPEMPPTSLIPKSEYNLTFIVLAKHLQNSAAAVSDSAVNYFTDALRRLVITRYGWPFYGFTPSLFLDVLPGLIPADFNNVQAEQGIYKIKEEELVFEPAPGVPTHASAEAISAAGMKDLLKNVSLRKNMPVTDTQSVINLLKSLKINPNYQ